MALRRRCPGAGLMHHSDQGSPYASEDYQRGLETHSIACSMSRRGNCYDNAVIESWFKRLKAELGSSFYNHVHAKETSYSITLRCSTTSSAALGYRLHQPAEHQRTTAMRQAASSNGLPKWINSSPRTGC